MPLWCRCGQKTKLGKKLEPERCICEKCTAPSAGPDALLCKRHLAALDAMILNKVSILGSVPFSSLSEMVEFHFGQNLRGDLAYLVSLCMHTCHMRMWQIRLGPDGDELVYFSVALNRYVGSSGDDVKQALSDLGLPGAAFAIVCDDARLQKNGWMLNTDRAPVVATKESVYNKETLFRRIRAHSKTTIDVSTLIPLYENAAADILELLEDGKLCKINNGRLLCINTDETFDPGLRDYWMEHVAAELKTRE